MSHDIKTTAGQQIVLYTVGLWRQLVKFSALYKHSSRRVKMFIGIEWNLIIRFIPVHYHVIFKSERNILIILIILMADIPGVINKKGLSIVHLNARSALGKLPEVKLYFKGFDDTY